MCGTRIDAAVCHRRFLSWTRLRADRSCRCQRSNGRAPLDDDVNPVIIRLSLYDTREEKRDGLSNDRTSRAAGAGDHKASHLAPDAGADAGLFLRLPDRVNVGFAKLTMQNALGMSDAIFGFGAGVFFVGYFL